MKYIFCLLLLPICAFSQKKKTDTPDAVIPTQDGKVIYTEVVQADSVTAAELYQRAKRFFVETYKSANDVIQLDDEKAGEITGKGVFKVYFNMGLLVGEMTTVRHTVSLYVKDNRYKYEIKDISVNYYSSGTRIGTSYVSGHEVDNPFETYVTSKYKPHKKFAQDVNKEVTALILQIKETMTKKAETKKENW